MTNSLMGMFVVLIVFCVLLQTLRAWQRRHNPDPELVRKGFHLGMGLFTLALPWLFATTWPVWTMCGVTVALLLVLRTSRRLQNGFGAVLGGVARCSHGEMYFSLGVAALFQLAKEEVVLYVVGILLLTFADAAAALIGQRLGRHRFQSLGGRKSLEGSLAFLTVAVACIYAPLHVATNLAALNAVLIALTVALLLTLLEAMATRGLDNLLIPLGALVLLKDLPTRTTEELGAVCLFVVLFIGAILMTTNINVPRKRRRKESLV